MNCVYCGLEVKHVAGHHLQAHSITVDDHAENQARANPEGLDAPPSVPGELIVPPKPKPCGGYL